MKKRIGFIGILLSDRVRQSGEVNAILSEFGHLVLGRMGIPRIAGGESVITLIVEATTDEIGRLTGRLGTLEGVQVKSALSKDACDNGGADS